MVSALFAGNQSDGMTKIKLALRVKNKPLLPTSSYNPYTALTIIPFVLALYSVFPYHHIDKVVGWDLIG